MKQPALGITATVLVMAVSLGLISLFDFATFVNWVAYGLLCLIPMELVVGVMWGCKHPAFAGNNSQPAKGVLLVLFTAAVGAVIAVISLYTIGGGVTPPAPMLAHVTIVTVVVMFWMAIMMGGWPFNVLIKSPLAAGFAMLIACYVVNYILFRIFFNYEFMAGAPVYVASLDPGGLFNGWAALVFYLSVINILFVMLHFDLWPLTKSPGIMKQPTLGIVWTIIALVLGGASYWAAVTGFGMDPVDYMVTGPVPFIFGTIVMLNMLQASVFAKMQQPVKGIASAVAAAVIGTALARLYGALEPSLSGAVGSGPPGYEFEIWLASALLSVTFPFLIFYCDFFQFWPLKKAD